ncbi:MAG: ATP-dependent zinc protease [Candidatus Cloacimonetes bacterium]|nr:ATP-dependent zinc protease [Candidatus Cloacimonadota bacterium]
MKKKQLKVIGWRESVSLPDFGIEKINVKVDSGAATSSLHAFDMTTYEKGQDQYVKFFIHPEQRHKTKPIECHAKILEYRKIKSSNGQTERRPVILTRISLLDEHWSIELTLTNRDEMTFRMLLGRQSIRKRFLIDTGNSFYSTKVKRGISK